MQFPHHALIGAAINIPIPDPTPVISYSPVVLPAPGRPVDLQLRVVYPPPSSDSTSTSNSSSPLLPIILLAHGSGSSKWLSSLDGSTPLAEFYAWHRFAVLQPTLPDSRFLNLTPPPADDPDYFWWHTRALDFGRVLDGLDAIEDAVPGLRAGQLDRARVAVVGHSYGGTTASMLLGAANADPRTNAPPRICGTSGSAPASCSRARGPAAPRTSRPPARPSSRSTGRTSARCGPRRWSSTATRAPRRC